MFAYGLTIFTSAFLLFQVQPLIGKYILPWFGGAPAVWTTCMLFFQLLLLAGYAYAHLTTRFLSVRRQVVVHVGLLLAAVLLLPITPADGWKPHDSSTPTLRIMLLLAASTGLPYFVLSTTGPLLQAWFGRTHPGRSPYRLYALSNVGSLLALVSYPFWFEVKFPRRLQTELWSWGMGAFALVCAGIAFWVWRRANPEPAAGSAESEEVGTPPAKSRYVLWLALPACASALLLATTNKLCQDMAVTPFLWVLPLGLYLVSFVVCFDNPRWYSRVVFGFALLPAVAGSAWALFTGVHVGIVKQVAIHSATLFAGCMVCHGELYRLKPHPRWLTAYYLMIAAGGAVGGIAVAVVAPLVFTSYAELHWMLGLCLGLFVWICARDRDGLGPRGWLIFATALVWLAAAGLDRGVAAATNWVPSLAHDLHLPSLAAWNWLAVERFHWLAWLAPAVLSGWFGWRLWKGHSVGWHAPAVVLLGAIALVLAVTLGRHGWKEAQDAVAVARNFYGVLSVWEYDKTDPTRHYYLLQHGQITHGLQFAAPALARRPSSYYTSRSGVGLAVTNLPQQPGRTVAVVGLGTGTLAAYGRKGDRFRFYEINPDVERVARKHFSYLGDCEAKVDVVLGDARLAMEREPPQHFDLLALDAFSGDAIPVHLLTREAFEVYLRHLKPGGVIAVHISNRYLNLAPVVANLASHFKLRSATISVEEDSSGDGEDDGGEPRWWDYSSTWVLLTRDAAFLDQTAIAGAASKPEIADKKIPLWTDDYTSLYPVLQ